MKSKACKEAESSAQTVESPRTISLENSKAQAGTTVSRLNWLSSGMLNGRVAPDGQPSSPVTQIRPTQSVLMIFGMGSPPKEKLSRVNVVTSTPPFSLELLQDQETWQDHLFKDYCFALPYPGSSYAKSTSSAAIQFCSIVVLLLMALALVSKEGLIFFLLTNVSQNGMKAGRRSSITISPSLSIPRASPAPCLFLPSTECIHCKVCFILILWMVDKSLNIGVFRSNILTHHSIVPCL